MGNPIWPLVILLFGLTACSTLPQHASHGDIPALLKESENAIQLGEWGKANIALTKIEQLQPEHKRAKQLRKKYTRLRKELLRKHKTRLALAEANYLFAKQTMLEFEDKDNYGQWRPQSALNSVLHRKHILSEELMELSISALKVQDYKGAEVTFNVATRLNAQLNQPGMREAINEGLAVRTQSAIQTRLNHLLKKMELAQKEKNFKRMQSLTQILSNKPFNKKDVAKTIDEAKRQILAHAIKLDKEADKTYRRGDITKAIELWLEAKELAPHLNGLQDKLSRAEKVQSKLEKLRKS